MKATGIVRRIDDLGRVVIPKEIRRTLRLREGTPLEIFTDREGEIILKKYSPMVELSGFAVPYAEALAQNSGHMVCVTDREQVIAVAGGAKKDWLRRNLSERLEEILYRREIFMSGKGERSYVPVIEGEGEEKYPGQVVAPILGNGDVIGSVILLNREERRSMGELERKLAGTAAGFLGKQMES
ncbi:MAG: stage V sporulation protein T [Clostridiales bacterium]|nr:stage V sporulation protein T [Clostridiales bacterium]